MKHLSTIFSIAAGAFALTPAANAFELTPEMKETGLKTVVIETIDAEEPSCESIKAPAGSWGEGLTNVTKVPGSVVVLDCNGDILFDSGEYVKKESGMTVKVRGNTSARFDKKPFKIKLEKKGDMLSRGDKDLNDKNWLLLNAPHNLYRLGFLVSEWIGMPWTPANEYVQLVMNGDYRGLYLLTEAVERNEKCRIRTQDSGFVAERDPYWWNEDGQYLLSGWNTYFNWTMKYPDFEDLTDDRTAYIHATLLQFEDIISREDYDDYIDVDSFCKWVICQDIMGTSDGGGTNFYLAKDDDTDATKLYVPVLWDVDSGEETEDSWSAVHSQGNIKPLFENANTAFKRRFIQLYYQYSASIFANLEDLTAQMKAGEGWEGYDKAVALNNARWGNEGYASQHTAYHDAGDMEWWFPPRRRWLDDAVLKMDNALDVGCVTETDPADGSITVFSLSGTPVYSGPADGFARPSSGIYIVQSGGGCSKLVF